MAYRWFNQTTFLFETESAPKRTVWPVPGYAFSTDTKRWYFIESINTTTDIEESKVPALIKTINLILN